MMRKWLLPLLFCLGVYVFASRGLQGGPEITVDETAALFKGEPRPVLIDVRDRVDYDKGHIPGAMSVPAADLKARLPSLKLPQFDAVVLYGADDTRVRDSTRLLYENGYQGALTLKGGMAAWQAAGHMVQKPPAAARQ